MIEDIEKRVLLKSALIICRIRFAVAIILLMIGIFIAVIFDMRGQLPQGVLLGFFVLFYNTLGYLFLNAKKEISFQQLALITFFQINADAFVITLLTYLSGGVISPYAFLYLFPILSAGVILARFRWMVYSTTLAITILYDGFLLLEYFKVLPLPALTNIPWIQQVYANPFLITNYAILFPISLWILTGFISRAGRLIQKSRSDLEIEMKDEIADLKERLEKKLEATNAELYQKNKELASTLFARTQIEDSLKDSEEKRRLFIENAGEVIVTLDVRGTLLEVNRKALDLFGYTSKELIGKNLIQILPLVKADVKSILEAFKEGLSGNIKTDREWIVHSKKGERLCFIAHPTLIKQKGKTIGLTVILEDITKRKQAEEELKNRAKELTRMNKFMVGRELDMIELKKEVNRLFKEAGQPEKYKT